MTTSFNQILLAFWRQSNTDTNRWFRPVFYGVVLIGLFVVQTARSVRKLARIEPAK